MLLALKVEERVDRFLRHSRGALNALLTRHRVTALRRVGQGFSRFSIRRRRIWNSRGRRGRLLL